MVKINRFEVENVKRVQVVQVEPTAAGLTILGGRNGQGKTSVLDAIVWALGGNKYKPSNPKRDDSMADPRIHIELDNGLIVTRDGKNATLKAYDPQGNKAGQALLDELIGHLALDLPKFLQAGDRDKAEMLLQILGIGPELAKLDHDAERIYNERHTVGQMLTRRRKHAEDLPYHTDAPDTEVSASEFIQRQQAILARNGENQRLRQRRDELARQVDSQRAIVQRMRQDLQQAEERLITSQDELATASKSAEDLQDESTAEIESSIEAIDQTNQKVRINAEKRRAEEEAAGLQEQVDGLTEQLEETRDARKRLLDGAELPLPDLSILDGKLVYRNQPWDGMSSSEQLRVAVAIARRMRPECQFVLLDKLEQMDAETLADFGRWLESEDLQAIATRVSTGGECSILIEDGMVAGAVPTPQPSKTVFETEGF